MGKRTITQHVWFGASVTIATIMNVGFAVSITDRVVSGAIMTGLVVAYLAAPQAYQLHKSLADTHDWFDRAMKTQARSRVILQPAATMFLAFIAIIITPAAFPASLSALHVVVTLIYSGLLVDRLFCAFERAAFRLGGPDV